MCTLYSPASKEYRRPKSFMIIFTSILYFWNVMLEKKTKWPKNKIFTNLKVWDCVWSVVVTSKASRVQQILVGLFTHNECDMKKITKFSSDRPYSLDSMEHIILGLISEHLFYVVWWYIPFLGKRQILMTTKWVTDAILIEQFYLCQQLKKPVATSS